jgi:hypothetical protein
LSRKFWKASAWCHHRETGNIRQVLLRIVCSPDQIIFTGCKGYQEGCKLIAYSFHLFCFQFDETNLACPELREKEINK